jgi:hypothetical protein
MTRREIVEIAKIKKIRVGNMRKENIIRTIQRSEGNDDCFATTMASRCEQKTCLWREDCLMVRTFLIMPRTS